jgi:hypothetical protein
VVCHTVYIHGVMDPLSDISVVLVFLLFKYNHLAEREEAKNRSHAVMVAPGRYNVQKELGDV